MMGRRLETGSLGPTKCWHFGERCNERRSWLHRRGNMDVRRIKLWSDLTVIQRRALDFECDIMLQDCCQRPQVIRNDLSTSALSFKIGNKDLVLVFYWRVLHWFLRPWGQDAREDPRCDEEAKCDVHTPRFFTCEWTRFNGFLLHSRIHNRAQPNGRRDAQANENFTQIGRLDNNGPVYDSGSGLERIGFGMLFEMMGWTSIGMCCDAANDVELWELRLRGQSWLWVGRFPKVGKIGLWALVRRGTIITTSRRKHVMVDTYDLRR